MGDYFSKQADLYARFRPSYPRELFEFLRSLAPSSELAWDVATGNGQAAVALVENHPSSLFEKVVATDLSQAQIDQAKKNSHVEYRVENAEKTSLADRSVSLITVAQAAHWFDFDKFYAEVRRVSKPKGVIAIFGYHFFESLTGEMKTLVEEFSLGTLGPYWKQNNRLLWEGYRTIPFPFEEIVAPKFTMQIEANLDELLGYFATWSATQLYREATGIDPTVPLRLRLEPLWIENWKSLDVRTAFVWPICLRVGRLKLWS